jgi:hypothetical protein
MFGSDRQPLDTATGGRGEGFLDFGRLSSILLPVKERHE